MTAEERMAKLAAQISKVLARSVGWRLRPRGA